MHPANIIPWIEAKCVSALTAMMVSRKHRKYLYHMNNNARPGCAAAPLLDCMDASNNASEKRKSVSAEQAIGKAISSRTTLLEINQVKDKSMGSKDSFDKGPQNKYKIGGLYNENKFDNLDRSAADNKFAQGPSFDPTFRKMEKGRKDSVRPYDAKIPAKSVRIHTPGKELQLGKFTLGETVDDPRSDQDLATMANVHLSQREQALKLLAEIQLKMDKRQRGNEEEDASRKYSKAITPEEALQCAWLRLSKKQVATLEELIKQQGKEPGLHAHSDVSNYDVFAEIREIRNREKVLKEEE
ncbi:hypothetical protein BsWGS_22812 [Bradybaena similaris]